MRFFAVLFAVLACSSQVEAEIIDPSFKLSSINDVDIVLNDSSNHACWTNLKEVREYAEEKLRMKGVKVVDKRLPIDLRKGYRLQISTSSSRLYNDGTGPCWGTHIVKLVTVTKINGSWHLAVAGFFNYPRVDLSNSNKDIIEAVSKFLAEFK